MASNQPDASVVLVVSMLALTGCSATLAGGWHTGTPDAVPRAQKLSVRGPQSRDGMLLVGGELATEVDRDARVRVRRGAALAGVRLRDPELGHDPVAVELAGALGVGRGNFDPEAEDFGTVTGARVDVPIPLFAVPGASSSRARAAFFRFELVPYLHGDAIWRARPGDTVVWSAEGGLGIRVGLGTDMTGMDVFRQVF